MNKQERANQVTKLVKEKVKIDHFKCKPFTEKDVYIEYEFANYSEPFINYNGVGTLKTIQRISDDIIHYLVNIEKYSLKELEKENKNKNGVLKNENT